jgi:DNA polymerase III alpha subunit
MAGALDHIGERKELLTELLQVDESIASYKQKITDAEQKILDLTAENERRTDKTTKVYQKNLEMIQNRHKDIVKFQKKLKETQDEQKMLQKYDSIKGEIEVLSFSFHQIPKVLTGKLVKIFSKLDKNGHEMSWLTFGTDYGEFRCTVFWESWGKIRELVHQGESYVFSKDSKEILQEIKIDSVIYNFKKVWRK